MKIRTQLVLAFLLLSVLPLTGLVLYNYVSSQSAVRRAEEAEVAELAQEMNGRMADVRAELGRGVERVGEIPVPVLERALEDAETSSVLRSLGDAAPFLDSVELAPLAPPPAAPAASEVPHSAPPAPPAPPAPSAPPAVVVDVAKILREVEKDVGNESPDGDPEQVDALVKSAMQIAAGAAESFNPSGLPGGEGKVLLLPPSALTARIQGVAERKQAMEERLAMLEKRRKDTRLLVGKDLQAPIKDKSGRVVGYVRAQVRPEEVIQKVLGSRRRQGEIPYAVDSEGHLHAASTADLHKIQSLDLQTPAAGASPSQRILDGGWVVATSKDPQSGLTFGVVRPIGDALEEVKVTAARNFGWGLALIAFALVGILPLSNRMTRDVRVLTRGAQRIAGGDLDTRVAVRSRNEIGTLAAGFNRMAADLRGHQAKLVEQETEQRLLRSEYERKTRELEEARTFQLSLLPKTLPDHPGLSIAVSMQTATEVGGDYYDFHLSDDGVLTTAVGDATGHGARAGTMVTVIKSLFSADSGRSTPRQFLAEAAAAVKRMELGRMAMGLTLARLEEGSLTLAAAGMPPALLYRAASRKVEEIALQGMPLGGLAYDYQEVRLTMASGDTLLLMSDGLPELLDDRGERSEPFGYPRVRARFEELGDHTPEEVIAGLRQAADAWTGGKPPNDDVTFVVLRAR